MTCCIGLRCTDGILLASDSLVSGGTKSTLPTIKGFDWQGLDVLYSGDLAYIQKLQTQPCAGYEPGKVASFQQLMWDFPPGKGDEAEFLVVDDDWCMYIVDRWGASVPIENFGVVGSSHGWACMHMLEKRERTMSQGKRALAKVLRAVALVDGGVAEPFRYQELWFA